MQNKLTTSNTGKTDAARIPLCRSFSAEFVQSPTRDGPNVPPASPARARSAKSAVPPPGIRADVRLIEPGHIIATARPLSIQPMKEIIKHGRKSFIIQCNRCGCEFKYDLEDISGCGMAAP